MADDKSKDETVPGGLYIKEGHVVNAQGKAIPGYSVVNGEAVKDKPAKAVRDEGKSG